MTDNRNSKQLTLLTVLVAVLLAAVSGAITPVQ